MAGSNAVNASAFILLILAAVTTIVGFATDQWILVKVGNIGLVRYCMRDFCQYPWQNDIPELEESMPAWFTCCQVFMSLAVVFILLSVIAAPCFLCNACDMGRRYAKFICINLIITVCMMAIALSTMSAKVHYDRFNFPIAPMTTLSWSFYMTVTGGLALIIDWLLFLVSLRKSNSSYV